jgi:sterol desaturase/sphingolipid hydroxylase (fatty acid hydroxylase superfamily)
VGIAALFVVFVPLEQRFALVPRKVFRRGFVTDLTHLLLDGLLSGAILIGLVAVAAVQWGWLRSLDVADSLPPVVAVVLAVVIVLVGSYWGHRLHHQVPFLWRFHAVHHSIEEMDWLASGRLHPIDQALTQVMFVGPLFVLGYDAGVFGGAAAFLTFLALLQHANVRLRVPVLRWVINTPEWHHWHHARDDAARDTNFGVPVVDWIFGTAYLPRDRRPRGFGIVDPVPPTGYARQLAYPFGRRPPAGVGTGAPRH